MAAASGSGTGPGRSHTSKVAQTAPFFFICNHHRYRISTLSTVSRAVGIREEMWEIIETQMEKKDRESGRRCERGEQRGVWKTIR